MLVVVVVTSVAPFLFVVDVDDDEDSSIIRFKSILLASVLDEASYRTITE